jgi:acyl-CoA thioesterase-2
MHKKNELLNLLNCTRLEEHLFSGNSRDFGAGRIFGGQVFGQAIVAAQNTMGNERLIHSAHGYFLRAGDPNEAVIYEVDPCRDGRSYSSRRVTAYQHNKQIFNLSASFHVPENGKEYYENEKLPLDVLARISKNFPRSETAFQSELVDKYTLAPEERSCQNANQMWVKTRYPLPESQNMQRAILAYLTDMSMVVTMAVPHEPELDAIVPNLTHYSTASLDHSIWFHRPCRVDEWLFFDCRPESTGGGRGFSRGRIYNRDGVLVASMSQEAVFRDNSN